MDFKADVQGALDIEKALGKLTLRIEKNISRRAVGAAAKVLIREMKTNVPVASGTLKRSIGMKRLKIRKTVTVIIGPRAGKARQERKGKTGKTIKNSDGWYGYLVEFGTLASRTRPLSPRTKRKKYKNGLPTGMAPRPFMRPAFDTKSDSAIKAMANSYREGIARGR